jgi:hypothetical protein
MIWVGLALLYLLIGIMVDALQKIFFTETPDDDLPGAVAMFWPVWAFVVLLYGILMTVSKSGNWLSNLVIEYRIKRRVNARNKN